MHRNICNHNKIVSLIYIYIYTDMNISDDYVVRTLTNKRLYARYCSCSCCYEDK